MVKEKFIDVPHGYSHIKTVESHFVDKNGNYLTGLNSSKQSKKALPAVKQLLDLLQSQPNFAD